MTITEWDQLPNGKAFINKDPDARKRYGLELAEILAENSTSISDAVITEQVGVTSDSDPVIFGTKILFWVLDGDASLDENYMTIGYTLSDTSYDEKTVYFRIKDRLSWL